MSAPVTLANMILAVQQRANIENQVGFIPLAEIRGRINYACADIYDKLVTARAQEFYRATTTFSTSPSVSTYSLPATFYQLISVDVMVGVNQTFSAKPYMEFERNFYKWTPGWTYTTPVLYRLGGGNIMFVPTPNGIYTVSLNYYPRFTLFATNGADDALTFDGVNGWEEGVIWRVVSELKDKGEEDPSYATSRYMDIVSRIESLAAMRDAGNSERVHDVHASTYGSGWGDF